MGICCIKQKYSRIARVSIPIKQIKTVNDPEELVTNTVFKNPNKITKEYKIWDNHIGKGAFGEVRKVLHFQTGLYRAVKVIYKHECSSKEREKLIVEIEILRHLSHPNIIKIYEYFEDVKFLYIIMDLATGGELFDKIQKAHTFSERRAAEIFHQLLSGINYLHKRQIAHRDIKPENILFDGDILKIADFGTSRYFQPEHTMKNLHGTPYYIAPEVITGNYNEKCDVWSCGVILYILLSGVPPFQGNNRYEIITNVVKGKYTIEIPQLRARSSAARSIIRKMLTYDPSDRISIEQALDHEWFKIVYKKEEKLIPLDILENIKKFNTKNKMQKSIYFFMVSQLASKEDHNELISIFKSLDINNDGELSKEELFIGLRKVDLNLTEVDIEELINRIDNNKSQSIDYMEFVAAAINRNTLLSEEKMKNCFNIFDKDKNGKISINELKTILQGNEMVNNNVWKYLMEQADENKDGEIEYSEFKNLLTSMIN